MRIQHNIMAMSAYRNYTNNVSAMKKNLEKLSSGYKINRAGDDAAGLAISEKMRAQITGLETAQKNAKDGISLVQTAEGALTEVHDMLNRMVELATQSANGTYDNTTDRKQMQKEINQLREEIDRIADSSNFNGIKLLDGSMGLNQEAITGIKYLSGDVTVAGNTLASAAQVAATSDIHGSKITTFQAPSFTIDLGDMEITASSASATKTNIQITIAGVGTLTLASASLSAAGGKITASAIASAIAGKYTATASTASASAGGWIDIGGAAYKITATGAKLTLTLQGVVNASGTMESITSSTNTELFTSSMASAFNDVVKPGATVTVAATGGGEVTDANAQKYIHGVVDKVVAQADGGKRWGANITQNATSLMKDGNKLTIGVGTNTRTFTISISSTATTSKLDGSTVIISTKEVGTTATAQMNKFNHLLEGQTAGLFTISVKGSNQLHIDVTPGNDASTASWTKDTIKGAVKVEEANVTKTLNGVEFNVGALATGDVITVGEKSFVFNGTGTNGFANNSDLETKLKEEFGEGYVTLSGNKFTVYASKASANAPSVLGKGLTLQIGDTAEDFNQLNVQLKDMHVAALGIASSVMNIENQEDAAKAVDMIKSAINQVSDLRGTLGATQNRLDHTINNLSVMTENIQDAESTIRDVDVAEEMMAYTKNNILIQSAQAMLAQANQVPQGVLQLLG